MQGRRRTNVDGDCGGAGAGVQSRVVVILDQLQGIVGEREGYVVGPQGVSGGYETFEEDVLAGEEAGDHVCCCGGEEGEDRETEGDCVRLSSGSVAADGSGRGARMLVVGGRHVL